MADVEAGKIPRGTLLCISTSQGEYYDFDGDLSGVQGIPLFIRDPNAVDATMRAISKQRMANGNPLVGKELRKARRWAQRKKKEVTKDRDAITRALKARGFYAIDKRCDALHNRRFSFISKLANTRARTIEGLAAQARLIVYLIDAGGGSGWVKREDVKAAQNIAASLSKLAVAA
jgi:hypothetical protein